MLCDQRAHGRRTHRRHTGFALLQNPGVGARKDGRDILGINEAEAIAIHRSDVVVDTAMTLAAVS
eukprot:COSAG02_NODE_29979_length_559_cov_1.132609_1_plen_64_part_01